MVQFTSEDDEKHSLKKIGKKFVFSVKDLLPEDAGLYQVDVEGVNIFSTDFKSKAAVCIAPACSLCYTCTLSFQ